MPFNGTGTYAAPAADYPVSAGTLIESAKYNDLIADISTALTLCVTKDGQTTPTANLPIGGFLLTGLGVPSAAGHSLRRGSPLAIQVTRATNTIFGVNDCAVTLVSSAAYAQTFDRASTLTNGWFVNILHTGTGLLVLTPTGGDLINGAATLSLKTGESAFVFSTGAAFFANVSLRPRSLMHFSGAAVQLAAASTAYWGTASGGAEGAVAVVMPFACTVRNLYMQAGAVPGGGETFVHTLRKNTADTALTCTTSGAGSSGSSDLTHSVTFAAGDSVALKIVTSAGAAQALHWGVMEVEQNTL